MEVAGCRGRPAPGPRRHHPEPRAAQAFPLGEHGLGALGVGKRHFGDRAGQVVERVFVPGQTKGPRRRKIFGEARVLGIREVDRGDVVDVGDAGVRQIPLREERKVVVVLRTVVREPEERRAPGGFERHDVAQLDDLALVYFGLGREFDDGISQESCLIFKLLKRVHAAP